MCSARRTPPCGDRRWLLAVWPGGLAFSTGSQVPLSPTDPGIHKQDARGCCPCFRRRDSPLELSAVVEAARRLGRTLVQHDDTHNLDVMPDHEPRPTPNGTAPARSVSGRRFATFQSASHAVLLTLRTTRSCCCDDGRGRAGHRRVARVGRKSSPRCGTSCRCRTTRRRGWMHVPVVINLRMAARAAGGPPADASISAPIAPSRIVNVPPTRNGRRIGQFHRALPAAVLLPWTDHRRGDDCRRRVAERGGLQRRPAAKRRVRRDGHVSNSIFNRGWMAR
jgi:hypothetical protein